MKPILLAAFAGTLCLAPFTDLASRHEEGEVRTTTFSIDESSSLVDIQVLMNGELNPAGVDIQREQVSTKGGTFTDKILGIDDSDLSAFTRTYGELMGEMTRSTFDTDAGENTKERTMESPLDGLTVHFNREEGAFLASFPEDEDAGDEELLEDLPATLPFAGFLPEFSVEVDDEWEVGIEVLWDALNLLDGLALRDPDLDEEDSKLMDLINDNDIVEIEGEVMATLSSLEDGLATLTLAVEMIETWDLTEAMNTVRETDEDEGMGMPEMDLFMNRKESEGEGTLVWDLRGGHMVSLEIDLDFEIIQSVNMSMSMGPRDMKIEQAMTTAGELTATFEMEITRE